MDASFYPPRHQFNNNNYDDNLNQQHEALKRMMSDRALFFPKIYEIPDASQISPDFPRFPQFSPDFPRFSQSFPDRKKLGNMHLGRYF